MKNTTQTQFESAVIWINKLKTTRRKQGREMLGDSNTGYCCLGIACKVLNIEFEYDDSLSMTLIGEIGLKTEEGDFIDEDGEGYSLVDLNDTLYFSFKKIANKMKKVNFSMFNDEVAELLTNHYV